MLDVTQIAEGFVNNALNKEQDLFKERISICRRCQLHKIDTIFGEVCNKKLYVNPKTNEISNIIKEGFYNGCGCVLASKARVPRANCPLNRW